jgi:hypothetical protein
MNTYDDNDDLPAVLDQSDPADEQPETPAAPAFDMDALAAKIAEQMRPAPAPREEGAPADPYEKLGDLMYTDPAGYHREVTRIATEQAKQSILSELGPTLQPLRGMTYDRLTAGMDPAEKQYIDGLMGKGLSPEQILGNPDLMGLVRDAAYGAKQRSSKPAPRGERIGGGAIQSESEMQDREEFERHFKSKGGDYDEFMRISGGN